jgi:hypothetical protein
MRRPCEATPAGFVAALAGLDAEAWAFVGCVVTIATLAVGLVVTALEYRSIGDRRALLFAVAVLAILGVSLLVALVQSAQRAPRDGRPSRSGGPRAAAAFAQGWAPSSREGQMSASVARGALQQAPAHDVPRRRVVLGGHALPRLTPDHDRTRSAAD